MQQPSTRDTIYRLSENELSSVEYRLTAILPGEVQYKTVVYAKLSDAIGLTVQPLRLNRGPAPDKTLLQCCLDPRPFQQECLRAHSTVMLCTGLRQMASQLPELPVVERLSSRVLRILGGNPSKVRPIS